MFGIETIRGMNGETWTEQEQLIADRGLTALEIDEAYKAYLKAQDALNVQAIEETTFKALKAQNKPIASFKAILESLNIRGC